MQCCPPQFRTLRWLCTLRFSPYEAIGRLPEFSLALRCARMALILLKQGARPDG